MVRVEDLAVEIERCLAAGCTATVGLSGNVYPGADQTDIIEGDPVVYRVSPGWYKHSEANVRFLAQTALEKIEEIRSYE
jgi:hypothetical protein